jgi:hypothetical protein
MVLLPHCCGPVVRQNINAEDCGGAKLLTSWQPGNREGMPMLAEFLFPLLFYSDSYPIG